MKLDTLYKRDKTGKKVLSCEIEIIERLLECDVVRTTGFIDGKKQTHIDIIGQGKQNRTIAQQAELEAKSHWNSKRDEGYKTFEEIQAQSAISYDKSLYNLQAWLIKALPIERTDASGVLKPMKATPIENSSNITGKGKKTITFPALSQRKLDGVRCFIIKKDDEIHAYSSSGKSYDISTKDIIEELQSMDIEGNWIFDGELYLHGVPLNQLNGWAGTKRTIPEHKDLQFHCFDIATDGNQKKRIELRDSLLSNLKPDSRIVLVETTVVNNINDINELHDLYVSQGYEGEIIRNVSCKYQYGIRSSDIFKKKDFQDSEFKIIGAKLGKRGSFDMVFELVTKDGKEFEAKPLGTKEKKEEYWNNLDRIIGLMATVRYLNLSEYKVPVGNPVFKVIRNYD